MAKFEDQANAEKDLQKQIEMLKISNEALDKERLNERQMRMKLETEYT